MDSVLVLIAAPGSGAITPDVTVALQGFGASHHRWLAEGEALDVPVFPRVEEFIATLGALPIDTNVVPSANRRKRLLLADMDSTMIHQECIDELGVVAGVGEHIKGITARAMRGELDFEAALKERVGLLKGLDQSVITTLLRDRITYMEGGRTLLTTMKANGAHTALVSGGFTAFTSAVAQHLGFAENRANTLLVEHGKLTGEVALPILGQEAKRDALVQLASAHGLTAQDAIAVGDGANDIPMLLAAGLGVALHAKPHVQAAARIRINHGDLTSLLYLQGYARSSFITSVS